MKAKRTTDLSPQLYPEWLIRVASYEARQGISSHILLTIALLQIGLIGFLLWQFSLVLVWAVVVNSGILAGVLQLHHHWGACVAKLLDENLEDK